MFVATLRLKNPAHWMKFDLFRVLSQDGVKQIAVTVNGADKSVTFTCTSTLKKEQTVIFNDRGIKVSDIFISLLNLINKNIGCILIHMIYVLKNDPNK